MLFTGKRCATKEKQQQYFTDNGTHSPRLSPSIVIQLGLIDEPNRAFS